VTYTVTFIAPATGSLTNLAAATSSMADPIAGNNTSSLVTGITDQADLDVTKTGPAPANAGDTITYTVEVVNLGLSAASSVVITDTLPADRCLRSSIGRWNRSSRRRHLANDRDDARQRHGDLHGHVHCAGYRLAHEPGCSDEFNSGSEHIEQHEFTGHEHYGSGAPRKTAQANPISPCRLGLIFDRVSRGSA
jgi:uncharacterized repeat protein (TIGR01451 family)